MVLMNLIFAYFFPKRGKNTTFYNFYWPSILQFLLANSISIGHLYNQVIKFSITNIMKLNLHAYRIVAIKYSNFSLVVLFPKVFNLSQIIQNKWVNIECKMFSSINGINSGGKYTVKF